MAGLDLEELSTKYEGYFTPIVRVMVGEDDVETDKKISVKVTDVMVQVTSDYKASIAEYTLRFSYNFNNGSFYTKELKKYICMGTAIKIYMGHGSSITEVFTGFIAGVHFLYEATDVEASGIRITALDIKGIMMANNSSKRLKANYYSDAVKEILDQAPYQTLKNNEGITSITITDTPDKPGGGAGGSAPSGGGAQGGGQADNRLEMVAESDYEFVIKAAKKFNYEFFTIGGNVVFRKAKANTQNLGEIKPHGSILGYDINYDITGVVGEVKVRTMDIGKASKIEVKKKNNNKFSLGSKAKPLIKDQAYVYIDSAIESQKDAENRAAYILEETSYRLGSIRMKFKGIPEFVPGRFIVLKDFGDAASNRFYITDVTHEYDGLFYTTTIEGKASTL
nr:hypothetical protein [uncultured Butyrivibrio sp.]